MGKLPAIIQREPARLKFQAVHYNTKQQQDPNFDQSDKIL